MISNDSTTSASFKKNRSAQRSNHALTYLVPSTIVSILANLTSISEDFIRGIVHFGIFSFRAMYAVQSIGLHEVIRSETVKMATALSLLIACLAITFQFLGCTGCFCNSGAYTIVRFFYAITIGPLMMTLWRFYTFGFLTEAKNTALRFSDGSDQKACQQFSRHRLIADASVSLLSVLQFATILHCGLLAIYAFNECLPFSLARLALVLVHGLLMSMIMFEPIWYHESVPILDRCQRIHSSWPYYLGFGLPMSFVHISTIHSPLLSTVALVWIVPIGVMAATNGRKHNPAVFERTLPVFIPFLTLSSVAVISLYNSGVSKIIHDYWHRRQPPEKTAHIFPEFHPGKSLPKIPKTEWCEYEEIRRNANQALHKDDVRSCEKEVKAGNSSNEPYIFVSDDLMSETEISLH